MISWLLSTGGYRSKRSLNALLIGHGRITEDDKYSLSAMKSDSMVLSELFRFFPVLNQQVNTTKHTGTQSK